MKIWQKIFITTLIIVTCVMIILGCTLVNQQFQDDLLHRMEQGKIENNSIWQDLEKFMAEQKSDILLDDEDFLFHIERYLDEELATKSGILLVLNDFQKDYSNHYYRGILENLNEKLDNRKGAEDDFCEILKFDDRYYVIFVSNSKLYSRSLCYIMEYDITDIYEKYHRQMMNVQIYCAVLGISSAVCLLVIIKSSLRPIRKLQDNIHNIAEGNYGKKIVVKGNNELSILAEDVNRMSNQIKKNMDEKERMLESRRLFIGDMAHEMKTPLTSILGFSDILSIRRNLPEEKRWEYSEYIYKEADRLKKMSGKLMELIQYDGKNIEKKPIKLQELLQEVIEKEAYIWKNKDINFKSHLCDAIIEGDADLIKSLIINLVDNAVKASSVGSDVEISMKRILENEKHFIVVSVKDNGIGIPEQEIEKILEPFYRVDKSRSKKEGGAGLGLTLCMEIIKLHNGKLTIESEVGKGSTFFCRFQEVCL